MKQGLTTQIGNITTLSGASSGAAGSSLSIIMGDGNATGPAAGGSLTLKGGAGTTTGTGGSIIIQPGASASGTSGSVQVLPFSASAGGTTPVRFYATNSTNFVALKASDTISANVTWTLPNADGTSGQFLTTNGSGTLSWTSVTATNVFSTITGNTGSTTVDIASDTLAITGSVGITTTASDAGTDTLSISLTRTGVTAKTTPVVADTVLLFNSASSDAPVYSTLTQIITATNLVTATANGILTRTAANTYASRTLTASSTAAQQGLVITNGDGVSGNPTLGLTINGLTAGSVTASTTIPSYDGTNNVKVTPAQIVAGRIVRNTFTNASLTTGTLAVTHNLGVAGVLIQVFDDSNKQIIPDDVTLTSNNVTTIDLTSFGTLAGTWTYVIFG